MIKLRSCRTCKYVTEELRCERCGGETVLEWKGYLFILDQKRSSISARANIEQAGEYAIKVR